VVVLGRIHVTPRRHIIRNDLLAFGDHGFSTSKVNVFRRQQGDAGVMMGV
jgi:hypothetical protein